MFDGRWLTYIDQHLCSLKRLLLDCSEQIVVWTPILNWNNHCCDLLFVILWFQQVQSYFLNRLIGHFEILLLKSRLGHIHGYFWHCSRWFYLKFGNDRFRLYFRLRFGNDFLFDRIECKEIVVDLYFWLLLFDGRRFKCDCWFGFGHWGFLHVLWMIIIN